jgi:hypothetical protein
MASRNLEIIRRDHARTVGETRADERAICLNSFLDGVEDDGPAHLKAIRELSVADQTLGARRASPVKISSFADWRRRPAHTTLFSDTDSTSVAVLSVRVPQAQTEKQKPKRITVEKSTGRQ